MKVKDFPAFEVRARIESEFLAQLMKGLCFFSHGRPRMISSCPKSVIRNRWRLVFPFILSGLREKSVIRPAWFGDPSTLCGSIG